MTQILTTNSTTAAINITAAAANEFILVAEGVTRASTNNAGLHSGGFGGTKVHVLGTLVGGLGIHLVDNGDSVGDYRVTIGSAGTVVGTTTYAVYLQDFGNRVVNEGEIAGNLIGVYSSGGAFKLANSGTITGYGNDGVLSEGAGGEIVNHGLIQSLGDGPSANAVDFWNAAAGGVSKLTNYGTLSAAGGVGVRGDNDGVDQIHNFGFINGDVLLYGGNDTFRNGGHVNGSVELGAGNDVFKGRGGEVEGPILGGGGNDTISGGVSDNLINGGGGSDVLRGGVGDDTIVGGAGVDRMTGGPGADTFRFNNVSDSGTAAANRDTITDFQQGIDLIDLSTIDADTTVAGNQAFAFIGSSAFSSPGQVRVFQQGGNTVVQVSNDGDTGAEMAITLRGLHALAAGDFIL